MKNSALKMVLWVFYLVLFILLFAFCYKKCKKIYEEKRKDTVENPSKLPPAATTTQPAPNPTKTNTAQMELVCELELPEIYAFSVDATSSYFVESYGVPVWIHFPGMDPLYFDGKTNSDGSAKSASKKEAKKRKAGTATICAATEKDKKSVIPVKIYKLTR